MSGGQDWAASVIRGDVDNPNLAHRIAVLRRELVEERRATESAVELLRVVSDAYLASKAIPHPLAGREIWISHDLWISISTLVALDVSVVNGKVEHVKGIG